jgi:sugar phosphate isomerase/epimerase
MFKEKIRIGTMVSGGATTKEYIRQILPHGFESFSISFWQTTEGTDLKKLAAEVKEVLAGSDAVVSSVSAFGNPLMDDEKGLETRESWKRLIDAAHLFGCDLVTGFAGRVVNTPIPESMPKYKKVFGPLAKRAADKGVRLAFENCEMGGDWNTGDWNIAQTPDCWELMYHAVPADNIGLQWEPCHQMVKLIDPMPQLRKWVKKIFCLHGKDATIRWEVIREHGIRGPVPWAFHRTPGFGDSNWADIITELRLGGFEGSIDIEGWHDPVYREDLEMTGQVHGLNYLKRCRGGSYVPNPKV